MDSEIATLLNTKKLTPVHEALLNYVEERLKESRLMMAKQYTEWDLRHETYRRRRPTDKNDVEALKQGLPRKVVVPMTYSLVNTFVAFGYTLFTQKERFYEFRGIEDRDKAMRECAEALIERDMKFSDEKKLLVQSLMNIARFSVACEVESWEKDHVWLPVQETTPEPTFAGRPTGQATVTTKLEKVLRREGNSVRTVSPYHIFTDAGYHITDWRKGQFVAWDEPYDKGALKQMEQDGLCTGIEFIEDYDSSVVVSSNRTKSRVAGVDFARPDKKQTAVCVTKLVIDLAPNEIKGRDGTTLGPDTVRHKWLLWIANDRRIIRAEPQTNLHGQFPVSMSFFEPDMHDDCLNSLSYIVDDLQGLVSWFMNSRMAAVSRTVDTQVIIDPLGINVDDVNSRQRVIRMQKAAAGKDVRRFFSQLEIKDSTQGHVGDMTNLIQLMQLISGVNDNAMGQYNGGRRSATEARSVMNGAAARMKMVFDVMWGMHYVPQANRLLINTRQEISPEEFENVCGPEKAVYFDQFKSTPQQLARSYDFVAFDGTLPSEKMFIAQQLMEVFSLIMTNPANAAMFNMDPNLVLKEAMELRGLGRGNQFAYQQVPQTLLTMLAAQNGPTNDTPVPGNAPA